MLWAIMSASLLYFRAANGSTRLPIGNATHILNVGIGGNAYVNTDSHNIHVRFVDADDDPVTPTGGTITIRASAIDEQWQEPSNGNGVINASEAGVEAAYGVPRFIGCVSRFRAVFSGIVAPAGTTAEILVTSTT